MENRVIHIPSGNIGKVKFANVWKCLVHIRHQFKALIHEAGEMFQWFRTPLALAEDLGSIPSIQIRKLITTCKSRSMVSDTLSGFIGHYTHRHRHTHRHIA